MDQGNKALQGRRQYFGEGISPFGHPAISYSRERERGMEPRKEQEHSILSSLLSLCCPAFAAAAKSLQSCLTLCNCIDGSPPGFPVPGIVQARTLEWVSISFSNAWKWKVKAKSLSRVRLFATPWATAMMNRSLPTRLHCYYWTTYVVQEFFLYSQTLGESSIGYLLGFPFGSAGKESACNVRALGSILGLGTSPGEGKAYPLQYSGLENSMDCIVHGVAKSWTRLSDFHFTTLHFMYLGLVGPYFLPLKRVSRHCCPWSPSDTESSPSGIALSSFSSRLKVSTSFYRCFDDQALRILIHPLKMILYDWLFMIGKNLYFPWDSHLGWGVTWKCLSYMKVTKVRRT